MIKPIGHRILVKLLPRYGDEEKKLNLIIVDKKRHYEGYRRGVVEFVANTVKSLKAGDVVIFNGDSGDSFGLDDRGANDGTEYRRLRVSDCLAVEENEEVAA